MEHHKVYTSDMIHTFVERLFQQLYFCSISKKLPISCRITNTTKTYKNFTVKNPKVFVTVGKIIQKISTLIFNVRPQSSRRVFQNVRKSK